MGLLAACLVAAQVVGAQEPTRVDGAGTRLVTLRADEGGILRFAWTASEPCVAYVWVSSDAVDPLLSVERPDGAPLSDDNSGGGTTAFVSRACAKGDELAIFVAGMDPAVGGEVALHVSWSAASEALDVAAREAVRRLDRVRARAPARPDDAAAEVEVAIAELTADPELAGDRTLRPLGDARELALALGARGAALRAAKQLDAWYEAHWPPQHPDVLANLALLGTLAFEYGEYEVAKFALYREVDRRAQLGDPLAKELDDARTRLCATLKSLGAMFEALEVEQERLAAVAGLPDEHPRVLAVLRDVAAAATAAGDTRRAAELERRVLEVELRALRPGDPDAVAVRVKLGRTLLALGEPALAREQFESVLDTWDGASATPVPHALEVREGLIDALLATGDDAAASSAQRALLEMFALTRGPDDAATLELQARLAATLARLGKHVDAHAMQEDVLRRTLALRGGEHPDTQRARIALADTLEALQLAAEAETLLRDVYAIYEATLEPLHPERVRLGSRLGVQQQPSWITWGAGPDPGGLRVIPRDPFAPQLVVLDPSEPLTRVRERRFRVRAVATDPLQIEDIRLAQDGEARLASELHDVLTIAPDGRSARLEWTVELPATRQQTVITLQALNAGGKESEIASHTLQIDPVRRELYVLALGVGDYDDDALDLRYPTKDVGDLVEFLRDHAKPLYERVNVLPLLDRYVDHAAVNRARNEFLSRARTDDTIVVYVAGHGVRHPLDDTYYFLTSTSTPSEPYDGIERDKIEALITSRSLRASRRVLLLDTCNSGESLAPAPDAATRGVAIEADFDTPFDVGELDRISASRAAGMFVLAATAHAGLAREVDGNGVFTRALLDGLAGAADADENGAIDMEELKTFVTAQVREKSGRRQVPTMPHVEGDNFPLLRVR